MGFEEDEGLAEHLGGVLGGDLLVLDDAGDVLVERRVVEQAARFERDVAFADFLSEGHGRFLSPPLFCSLAPVTDVGDAGQVAGFS
jgi:hypothetical protein